MFLFSQLPYIWFERYLIKKRLRKIPFKFDCIYPEHRFYARFYTIPNWAFLLRIFMIWLKRKS